jgi:hypothetical protein
MGYFYFLRNPWILLGIAVVFLVTLGYVAIVPYPLFSYEYNSIPNMSQFLSYTVSFFIPIVFAVRILYNPVAGRAVNPFNKRFISFATPLILIFILAVMWFFIVGWLTFQFEFAFFGMISPTFGADLSFLFVMFLVYIVLPILCLALVLPGGFFRNMRSMRRYV